jgi:hypothetical protein
MIGSLRNVVGGTNIVGFNDASLDIGARATGASPSGTASSKPAVPHLVALVKFPATSSRNEPTLTLAIEGPLETPIPPAFYLDARSAGRSLLKTRA